MPKDSIAIVGVGCRFPGGVNDTESFWKLLAEGREAVGEVPADRWNMERYFDAEAGHPRQIDRPPGRISRSDRPVRPSVFRHLAARGSLRRSAAPPAPGNCLGGHGRRWARARSRARHGHRRITSASRTTNTRASRARLSIIPGSARIRRRAARTASRQTAFPTVSISQGPSVAMDTACSSALTAVHAACEHIRAGRGDMALAGGVTVIITPGDSSVFRRRRCSRPRGAAKRSTLRRTALCAARVRAWSCSNGSPKRLRTAIRIQGVIVGTALNQDGHTNGISLPSAEAQARLVSDACVDAGVDSS